MTLLPAVEAGGDVCSGLHGSDIFLASTTWGRGGFEGRLTPVLLLDLQPCTADPEHSVPFKGVLGRSEAGCDLLSVQAEPAPD